MNEAVSVFSGPTPRVHRIALDRPWVWLACGWQDLRRTPKVSLAYGFVFTLLGFLILGGLWLLDFFYLILPLTAGFMLLGPILAVGLYEVSRRQGEGETATLAQAVTAIGRNASQIALMGVALMLFLLAWIRLATLIFAVFYSYRPPGLDNFVTEVFLSPQVIPFLLVGTTVGAVLAVVVFAISAISIPMLLDRPEANVVTAMATSVQAVRLNYKAMAIWAALIVLFSAAGLVTLYIGLIVAMPLIGHATWYAYRDMVTYES